MPHRGVFQQTAEEIIYDKDENIMPPPPPPTDEGEDKGNAWVPAASACHRQSGNPAVLSLEVSLVPRETQCIGPSRIPKTSVCTSVAKLRITSWTI